MSDFDEKKLRDALRAAGGRLTPGLPDFVGAQRALRSRRHARQALGVGTVALVGALIAALVVLPGGSHSSDKLVPVAPAPSGALTPSPTSAAPSSSPPTGPGYYAVVQVAWRSSGGAGDPGAIVLVSAESGQKVRELVPASSTAIFGEPVISPSGRYVYFSKLPVTSAGNTIPGAGSVWRIPIDGGPAAQLPVSIALGAYLNSVLPSPDDSSVALAESTQASTIGGIFNTTRVQKVVNLETGEARILPSGLAVAGWLPDGHRLVTYDSETGQLGGPVRVKTYDLSSGRSTDFATIGSGTPSNCNFGAVAVIPNGSIAVLTQLSDRGQCGQAPASVNVAYIDSSTGSVTYGPILPFSNYETSPRVAVATDGSLIAHPYGEACYGGPPFYSTVEFKIDGTNLARLTLNLPVCV